MQECKQCKSPFEVTTREKTHCERMQIPTPDHCRPCRLRALMATRNEWKLYSRKCDFTGDEIISAYPPDSPFKVYKNEVWWGSDWNAMDFGRDYDFSRPFFEQFAELQKAVPREGTTVFNSENCDYNCHIRESRNCYLNSLVYRCEDLYYSYWMVKDKDVFDSAYTNESTLCYNCIGLNNGYECVMVEESDNCTNCYFSYQLKGCDNCLFCTNLANKSYHIFNKPCSKEEFEKAKNKLLNGSWKSWQEAYKQYLDIRKKAAHRYVHNLNCENCTGDHLYNCKDCEDSYEGFNSEDCVSSISLGDATSVYSSYSAGWPDCPGPVFMSAVTRAGQNIAYSSYTWFSANLRYSDGCNACDNCFGCIGLQHKKYCILNKQYSKEEYEKLIPKIIEHMKQTTAKAGSSTGEWGQFFPPHLSTYAYNETSAMDFFPVEKDQATKLGYRWREKEEKEYQPSTVQEIPDNIKDIDDDFTKQILACTDCGKNYKIIKQELEFYRKTNLPIPHHCPDCRHQIRFKIRNPLKLFSRQCDQCKTEIKSTYSPNRQEKVYCEKCYLKEVY